MKLQRRHLLAAAAVALGSARSHSALASSYPKGPVRVVIPFPPGGPTDVVGRLVCQVLGEVLGQPFIVENRAGAGGNIGADVVAKSRPDGQTLLINVSSQVINPFLYAHLPFDAFTDFTPVTGLASTPMQLIVRSSLPVRSVDDLVRYVRENSGKCSFGSSSTGTPGHLAGELFKLSTGINSLHVPYRGSSPALTDLVGGQITYMFDSMPSSLPLVQAGALRALAVTGSTRAAKLPEVPTMAEAGFSDIVMTNWYGLWAPARTSAEIINRLQAEVASALARPELKLRLSELSAEGFSQSPSSFAAFCRSEADRYAKTIKASNILME